MANKSKKRARKNKKRARALMAALLAAMLMGSLCIFVRESGCSAQACSLARFGIGFLIIGSIAIIRRLRGRGRLSFSPASFASGVSIGLCILFYFLAIQYTSAAIAALLPATGPLLSAVWESLLEKRLPPRRDVLLLLTAGLGIVIVATYSPHNTPGHDDAQGILYGILCGLCYSFYLVLNRCMSAEVQMMQRLFWQSAAGALVLLIPLYLGGADALQGLSSGWPWLIGIGVLQGVGVLALVAYAMRHLTSLEFGIISCLEPTEATLIGRAVYAEAILPGQWPGFLLVLITIISKSQRHLGWKMRSLLARQSGRRRVRA
ncbi:MAG: EamA family transporter [Akkermansiaceae bacterium]|nr:EamA family transporter [Akkermansiaceae bacterium]